jgi:hypothetical protein
MRKYSKGLGYFLVSYPCRVSSRPVRRLAGQPTFELVTVQEAQRYFKASVLSGIWRSAFLLNFTDASDEERSLLLALY